MAQKTLPLSAGLALLAVIKPDATSVGVHSTDWISVADAQSIMGVIMAGALGAAATLDAKFEQAKDDAGSDVQDIDGAAISQLTKAGGDDDKQAVVEFWAEDLDIKNGYTHVRLSIEVAEANSDLAALVLGGHVRTGPATELNAQSVAEIVTV